MLSLFRRTRLGKTLNGAECCCCFDKSRHSNHECSAEYYAKAATLPEAAAWDRRFSAYELSYCEGREREAYDRLRGLYDEGDKERLPTLIKRLKLLEDKLAIPQEQRIPDTLTKR